MPRASRKLPVAARASMPDGGVGHLDALLGGHALEHAGDLLERRALEVEAVAAVDDRGRHLVRLGGGEHEDHVRGGSSSVFRNAFQAAVESMCASSRMYTRLPPCIGASATFSRSSRMSSTELFEAASISTTSSEVPAMIAGLRRLGVEVGAAPPSALSAQASSLAIEVLPVPREPTNR